MQKGSKTRLKRLGIKGLKLLGWRFMIPCNYIRYFVKKCAREKSKETVKLFRYVWHSALVLLVLSPPVWWNLRSKTRDGGVKVFGNTLEHRSGDGRFKAVGMKGFVWLCLAWDAEEFKHFVEDTVLGMKASMSNPALSIPSVWRVFGHWFERPVTTKIFKP